MLLSDKKSNGEESLRFFSIFFDVCLGGGPLHLSYRPNQKKLLTYAIIEKQKFKTDGAYVCAIGLQLFVNGC